MITLKQKNNNQPVEIAELDLIKRIRRYDPVNDEIRIKGVVYCMKDAKFNSDMIERPVRDFISKLPDPIISVGDKFATTPDYYVPEHRNKIITWTTGGWVATVPDEHTVAVSIGKGLPLYEFHEKYWRNLTAITVTAVVDAEPIDPEDGDRIATTNNWPVAEQRNKVLMWVLAEAKWQIDYDPAGGAVTVVNIVGGNMYYFIDGHETWTQVTKTVEIGALTSSIPDFYAYNRYATDTKFVGNPCKIIEWDGDEWVVKQPSEGSIVISLFNSKMAVYKSGAWWFPIPTDIPAGPKNEIIFLVGQEGEYAPGILTINNTTDVQIQGIRYSEGTYGIKASSDVFGPATVMNNCGDQDEKDVIIQAKKISATEISVTTRRRDTGVLTDGLMNNVVIQVNIYG